MQLQTDITYIPGIGPKKAATLTAELGIRNVEDLITHFPYRYVDRSRFGRIAEINEQTGYIQLKGRLVQMEKRGEGRSQRLVARFTDGSGYIELVWFKGIKYVEDKFRLNMEYIVFGKTALFGQMFNIAHPEIEPLTETNVKKNMGWQSFYNTTEKMKSGYLNSEALRKLIFGVLNQAQLTIPETLPEALIKRFALMSRHEAIHEVHFPKNSDLLNKAQKRLKFEELFYIQLSIIRQSKLRSMRYQGYVFGQIGYFFNTFFSNHLPFELTLAQKRVLKEIRADLASGKQMNRLLQGDVGSGKTMVALMTCLMAIDNQFQTCIMAPTEILATQHYRSILEQTEGLGINVRLLTGSTRKKERTEIAAQLADGSLNILIGTHALIEDSVQFQNLGLVVIDEQHRFGVAQRAKLWTKNLQPPHILVMTATPIPRTLAMTIYGDLEVSVIDELPPGRKPIATHHLFDNKRDKLNSFIDKEIKLGRQVYIVYPLIQESEKFDYKNLEMGYSYIKEQFPNYQISMVHGKMKPADKEAEMQRFLRNETQIMVATTVIEVGVNVPNASVMVIESSERFGLSQLHQLRGRVGRGAEQSYCILMSSYKISNDTRKRLQIMVDSTDGFVIAEADLNLRGPGDLDGTQQSGLPFDLKIANIATDSGILQVARQVAKEVLDDDPTLQKPENLILDHQLKVLQRTVVNWGVIS